MFQFGIYEQLINSLISNKLNQLDTNEFYLKTTQLDKNEASIVLTQYLSKILNLGLNLISGEDSIEKQINLVNKIILLLKDEIEKQDFEQNLLDTNTSILKAILPKIDSKRPDLI